MIHLDNISKNFGAQIIFDNASLHIAPHMRLGLIGANGVGKTTLFKILLSDEPLNSGVVRIRKGIKLGYVPQEIENLSGETVLNETLSVIPETAVLETKIETASKKLEYDPHNQDLLNILGSLQEQLSEIDGFSTEVQAKTILCGLGFREHEFHKRLDTLSGGWKMRVALAKILLQSPDVLLLDEPTNHLDLESLIWLENFLLGFRGSIVLISHDRFFLDKLVTHIAEISLRNITVYTGNYTKFETEKDKRLELLQRQAKNQQKQITQTERFIERFRAKNTLATRVQSKIKLLEKIERIEVPEYDQQHVKFTFPQPQRSGLKVVILKEIQKYYSDLCVYENLNFEIERQERIALVGLNGAGKSTLLKLIAGVIRQDQGSMELGHNVTNAYYAQHQLDSLDINKTVLESIEGLQQEMPVTRLRAYLGAFLFSGDDVEKKVSILSGGEKARLALARIFINPANLLLMDEPTNHLDIAAQDVLIQTLRQYTGTMICISHDRRFINAVCTKVVAIDAGILTEYPGDYDYYIWKKDQKKHATQFEKLGNKKSSNKQNYEERKRQIKAERKRKRQIKEKEDLISELEREIAEIDKCLNEPETLQDYTKLQTLLPEQKKLKNKLDRVYADWLDLLEIDENSV